MNGQLHHFGDVNSIPGSSKAPQLHNGSSVIEHAPPVEIEYVRPPTLLIRKFPS